MLQLTSFIFLLFCLLPPTGAAAADSASPSELTGRDIAILIDKADSSRDARQTMLMVIERGSAKLSRKMEMFTKKFPPDERGLIRFLAPSDIRNTSYLTWSWDAPQHEDDMWVFMPSENLVRRISGGGKTGSFMRSDMANEDIEKRSVLDDSQTLLRTEKMDGTDCWVVEYVPVDLSETGYSKRVAWVRQDIHLPARIDYYDKRGKLLKTARYGGFVEKDGIWRHTRMIMQTPRKKTRTLVQIADIQYNTGLPDTFFEQSNLPR